jgi:hypothetical protein
MNRADQDRFARVPLGLWRPATDAGMVCPA